MEGDWDRVSKKIRVTPELVEEARKAFAKAEKKSIISGKGLSRGELKALERAGYVRKMIIFGKQKYSDQTGSQSYIWQWVGEYEGLAKRVEMK